MGTVSLALVLATATNRAYARRLAILLERQAFDEVFELRRERRRWIVPAVAAFLVLSLGFTRQLLAVFRPDFADAGAPAPRLLALVTAFTVVFGLAPTYLKYRRHTGAAFVTMACAAGAQVLLLLLLVPHLGATGAAAAYAASMCGMYAAFAVMAHRELRRLRAGGGRPRQPHDTP
jgi:O-antigen/teichoic acid export membrane protein